MAAGQLPPYLAPFQLLELNIISAQELCPVTRGMKTYAVAWVHPDRKLSTRVDPHGHANPTWNDKFVFKVNDEFLYNETSAVMIEIYACHWWRDVLVGTVRVLLDNLIARPSRWKHQLGMRFVALQVRRPSGRPQGLLNVGVGLLDSSMRSMPLYSQVNDDSDVGYNRNLIGLEDSYNRQQYYQPQQTTQYVHNYHHHEVQSLRPELRRTRSDTSSMVEPIKAHSSMVSSSIYTDTTGKKKGKASSWVSGSTTEIKGKSYGKKKKKASSMISGSTAAFEETKKQANMSNYANKIANVNPPKGIIFKPQLKREPSMKRVTIGEVKSANEPEKAEKVGYSPRNVSNGNDVQNGGGKATNGRQRYVGMPDVVEEKSQGTTTPPRYTPLANDIAAMYSPLQKLDGKKKPDMLLKHFITESDIGPSPSEVAIATAKKEARMQNYKVAEPVNSVVGGWSLDSSVEGLQSKLDRWRTELPPVYDRSEFASYAMSEATAKPKSVHKRSRTDGDQNGGFSCFSNICGIQCSIVCGGNSRPTEKKGSKGRGRTNSRVNDSTIFI